MVNSVCNNIYEKNEIKLGMLLSLIGGVSQRVEDSSSMKIRGQIHLLMVGEPGTGKSQFLRSATMMSKRSVMTTGIGTTSAGLTVAAFKEGSEFILEAGALVLADCGVCTIDEFSLLKPEDRASIHEAMEQQTISVAKAGIVCRINTRTTIIAATNPLKTQKWDPNCDIQQNTGIMSSLLSRFDLIFIVVDEHHPDSDKFKAQHVLMKQCISNIRKGPKEIIWSEEKMCEYVNFV